MLERGFKWNYTMARYYKLDTSRMLGLSATGSRVKAAGKNNVDTRRFVLRAAFRFTAAQERRRYRSYIYVRIHIYIYTVRVLHGMRRVIRVVLWSDV